MHISELDGSWKIDLSDVVFDFINVAYLLKNKIKYNDGKIIGFLKVDKHRILGNFIKIHF